MIRWNSDRVAGSGKRIQNGFVYNEMLEIIL